MYTTLENYSTELQIIFQIQRSIHCPLYCGTVACTDGCWQVRDFSIRINKPQTETSP